MTRIFLLLACAGALLLGACGQDSSLPAATGKASIRAINAIPTSEGVNFLIEERPLGLVQYQEATAPAQYDDLEYTFNFDVLFAGETSFRRIASEFIDVEASKNYTLLISGDVATPTITVWQDDERTFGDADTVFAGKFAHAAASLGALDYYLADATVAPALGNELATLSFGDISAAADFAEGDYVLTITTAGDPNDVVFTSETITVASRDVILFTTFDGDASDTAPVFVRANGDLGTAFAVPDVNHPPTVEFVNASMDLGTSDIYDDEALTSLRVAGHAYGEISAELGIPVGTNTFYYTPTGDTSVVSIETQLPTFGGLRYRFVATGLAGDLNSVAFLPDRRPVETQAKMLAYQASNNFTFLDLYAVEADASIDDVLPIRAALTDTQAPTPAALVAGTYDLYVTDFNDKDILAGPYRIDVALGDIVDLVILDTVDPAVLDILFLSGGPTP